MIARSRVFTLPELATVEGKRELFSSLFPDSPAFATMTAEDFDAIARAYVPEAEWLGRCVIVGGNAGLPCA